MKKNIYSFVSALILSVILTLIFPTWFLRGDARWTHLNDTARVDIYFEGSPKNGRVEVGGKDHDLIITRPEFLSVNRSQGVVVEIPVSYRTKSYKIKFTPQADEWGNNTKVIIRFMSQYFQYDGKKRPAWVVFRNITLNGQPVAGERVVWHDQRFIQKYPLHSSEINTLTFDVHKPLVASDISFVKIVALFFACLLLSLFFAPLKQVADRVLTSINRKYVVSALKDSYLHIDPVYRRSFWIIFGVLCFAFGLHAIWFLWGNHDWPLLEFKQKWLSHQFDGRYMLYSVKVLFSNGVYLPVIYDLIAFIALALNAVLLCKYWRLEKSVIYFVLCGLMLTAQPFTLGVLYFVHLLPEVFIGVSCVLVALILSENISTGVGGYTIRHAVYLLLSIVLINFALAMYPVLINTIAVAFVGKLLILSFAWDGAIRSLKSYLMSFAVSVTNIAIGVVSYKLILTFVLPPVRTYNTETLRLEQIPERLGDIFKRCFHQLYEYNSPFITQWILWIFLGFTILLALYICTTGNFKQKIVRLVLLFGSLFATQTAMIIAKQPIAADRVEFFGLVFFEVLMMTLVFTQFRKLRNISVVIGTITVFSSIINDLDCLRVWKLDFYAEEMMWNRVLARLEMQKGFDPTKKYDVVQVGKSISMRQRYYTGENKHLLSPLLHSSYSPRYSPFRGQGFFYPTRFRREGFTTDWPGHRRHIADLLKQLYQVGVLQKAEVWPKPNGLIVWKNIILFVTDGKELAEYKKQFERELGKK